MCKSLAEGGQRCFSHANKDYQNALAGLKIAKDELDGSQLALQRVRNNIEILDISYEMGDVNDEQYNNDLDVLVAERNQLTKDIEQNIENEARIQKDVDRTISEVRTTPTGLKQLKERIDREQNPVEKHRLQFAYDSGNRLRNVREAAFKRYGERQEKAKELKIKAQEKFALSESMPEYDYQTRQIKETVRLDGELLSAKAYLEENNGREVFVALFDNKGNIVPAKLTPTKYGHAWGILSNPKDPSSKYKSFVTIPKNQDPEKRAAFYASKGLTVGKVWADAKASIVEDENKVKKVRILRSDGGFSPFAEIMTTDQYKK